MEYIYADLVRRGRRTLASVPKSKIVPTAVLLIVSKDKGIDDVPDKYKTETIEALNEQGYNEHGEPLNE
jgi:metal-dependent HD superfamily phosphatase/phosphodiesterase